MIERIRVRCPTCRCTLPLTVLWAVGEVCPRCSQRVNAARRRSKPAGVAGQALALLTAESRPSQVRSELGKK